MQILVKHHACISVHAGGSNVSLEIFDLSSLIAILASAVALEGNPRGNQECS